MSWDYNAGVWLRPHSNRRRIRTHGLNLSERIELAIGICDTTDTKKNMLSGVGPTWVLSCSSSNSFSNIVIHRKCVISKAAYIRKVSRGYVSQRMQGLFDFRYVNVGAKARDVRVSDIGIEKFPCSLS